MPNAQWSPNGERLAALVGDSLKIFLVGDTLFVEEQVYVGSQSRSALAWSPAGERLAIAACTYCDPSTPLPQPDAQAPRVTPDV